METEARPARLVAPGAVLKRELGERGLTREAFASEAGVSASVVGSVIAGRRRIDPRLAIRLSEALGTSAEFWMSLETNYRLGLERRSLDEERAARAG